MSSMTFNHTPKSSEWYAVISVHLFFRWVSKCLVEVLLKRSRLVSRRPLHNSGASSSPTLVFRPTSPPAKVTPALHLTRHRAPHDQIWLVGIHGQNWLVGIHARIWLVGIPGQIWSWTIVTGRYSQPNMIGWYSWPNLIGSYSWPDLIGQSPWPISTHAQFWLVGENRPDWSVRIYSTSSNWSAKRDVTWLVDRCHWSRADQSVWTETPLPGNCDYLCFLKVCIWQVQGIDNDVMCTDNLCTSLTHWYLQSLEQWWRTTATSK